MMVSLCVAGTQSYCQSTHLRSPNGLLYGLQGLWQIRNFTLGNMALVPEFLCVINGVVGQIGDIAVMAKGDIAVSVL